MCCLYGCVGLKNVESSITSESCFIIKKIIKKKHHVYILYAVRNDSIYKIVSYFDKNKCTDMKIRKGTKINVTFDPMFVTQINGVPIIQPCNLKILFHGVSIGLNPEKGINEIWFSKEINGKYVNRKNVVK